MDFNKVRETTKEPFFTVRHKILAVPKVDYEGALKSYVDPYCEEGAQEFVAMYLNFKNDPGIVGLVGLDQGSEEVLIDAAVRYNRNDI